MQTIPNLPTADPVEDPFKYNEQVDAYIEYWETLIPGYKQYRTCPKYASEVVRNQRLNSLLSIFEPTGDNQPILDRIKANEATELDYYAILKEIDLLREHWLSFMKDQDT